MKKDFVMHLMRMTLVIVMFFCGAGRMAAQTITIAEEVLTYDVDGVTPMPNVESGTAVIRTGWTEYDYKTYTSCLWSDIAYDYSAKAVAIPAPGYKFVEWQISGDSESPDAVLVNTRSSETSIVSISGDATLTAVFQKLPQLDLPEDLDYFEDGDGNVTLSMEGIYKISGHVTITGNLIIDNHAIIDFDGNDGVLSSSLTVNGEVSIGGSNLLEFFSSRVLVYSNFSASPKQVATILDNPQYNSQGKIDALSGKTFAGFNGLLVSTTEDAINLSTIDADDNWTKTKTSADFCIGTASPYTFYYLYNGYDRVGLQYMNSLAEGSSLVYSVTNTTTGDAVPLDPNNDPNADGRKATFTMPADDDVNVNVNTFPEKAYVTGLDYIGFEGKAYNTGTEMKVYVLDGSETVLGLSGETVWYVSNTPKSSAKPNGITFTNDVTLAGDVCIILADGSAMTVQGSISGDGKSLYLFGQEGSTGSLDFESIACNDVTITGGVIRSENTYGKVIYSNNIVITGGQVTIPSSNSGYGSLVASSGRIYLGWTLPTDCYNIGIYDASLIALQENKRFVAYDAATGTAATAVLSNSVSKDSENHYSSINGKWLRPLDGYTVTVADGISVGTLSGSTFTAADPGFTITTDAGTESVVTTPYYLFKASTEETPVTLTLSYSGTDFAKLSDLPEGTTLNPVDGKPMQRSFAMPAEDVALTTTAVDVSKFTLSPSEFICDGTAKTPSVMNGESVFDAANYTMAFKDGDDASIIITEAKKVGDYNVILTGCGQYLGTATLTNAFSIKTRVKFSVVDVANGEELVGATVQVIDSEGNVVDEWNSTDESHVIEGLKTGVEYTLRETVAPDSYIISTDITFTIDKECGITTSGSMTQDGVLLVENSKTKVEISVIDIADGEELAGATVQVIDSKGDVVDAWTSTDESHVIEGLKTGEEYTLKETVAPDGYTIPADITFTIDETGKITTTGTITESGVLLVENSKTKVKVSVVDIKYGEKLAGATVQVIDSEKKVVDEWTSTAESHVTEGLKTGEEYTLRETVAPDSYIISTDITFTIDETGKITTNGSMTEDGVLLVENTKTRVKFIVVDIANREALGGSTVQAIDSEGKVVEECITSKWNPVNIIDGLKTGVEYTLHEANVPEGYVAPADYTFTIAKDGKVTTTDGTTTTDEEGNTVLVLENTKTKVNISVVNKATGAVLGGAHVQVIDSKGNVVEEWTSTDESHVTEGLKTGVAYTLHETVAPEGYTIPADITFTIDETGEVTSSGHVKEDGTLLVENPFTVPLFAAGATNLWMTWCDKYEYVKPEGVTVYTVSGVENNTVTLGEVSDVIPAYTPVLIYRAAAGTAAVTAVFSSLGTGTDGIQTAEATGCTFYGNSGSELFKDEGTTKYIFPFGTAGATEQSYILKDGCFVVVSDKSSGIAPHRCWLNVSKDALAQSGNSNARSLSIIMDDGETTAIESEKVTVNSEKFAAATVWYTIDGRKLNKAPTQKGIYIHNGKKVVMK